MFEGLGYNKGVSTALALLCTDENRIAITIEQLSNWRKTSYIEKIIDRAKRKSPKNEGDIFVYKSVSPRHLPQGACTSPAISNICMRPLDFALDTMTEKANWVYTRYADDLYFSFPSQDGGWADFKKDNLEEDISRIISESKRFLSHHGFKVNHRKTQVMRQDQRQMVLGLLVNNQVKLPRAFRKKLRAALHWANRYPELQPYLINHIRGLISFTKMVDISLANEVLKSNPWLNRSITLNSRVTKNEIRRYGDLVTLFNHRHLGPLAAFYKMPFKTTELNMQLMTYCFTSESYQRMRANQLIRQCTLITAKPIVEAFLEILSDKGIHQSTTPP